MRKIQAILDQADHPNTSEEESAVFRAKANELIIKHAVESWELEQAKPVAMRRKPELRDMVIYNRLEVPPDLWPSLSTLADALITYNRCKFISVSHTTNESKRKVLGIEADLDLVELMFLRIRLHISENLAPKVDPKLSWELNLVALKEAGYKWQKIHTMLDAAHLPNYPWQDIYWAPGTRGTKFTRFSSTYTDYCKAHGRDRMYVHPEVWRRDFIRGYVEAVHLRILEMKRMNDGYKGDAGSGVGLALLDIERLVQEAYYEMFPDRRPHPETCQCESCHYRKCTDRNCQRPNCKRYWADYGKPVRYRREKSVATSLAATQAGRRVGASVDLSKGSVRPHDRPLPPAS